MQTISKGVECTYLPPLSEAKALNNLAAHCFTMASLDVSRDKTAS